MIFESKLQILRLRTPQRPTLRMTTFFTKTEGTMNDGNQRRVELFDTSLRDGMQQPNLEISVPNAISLLQRMSAFGVHYAEIGFAGAYQFVADLTPALADADIGAMQLALFGRTRGPGKAASGSAVSTCPPERRASRSLPSRSPVRPSRSA